MLDQFCIPHPHVASVRGCDNFFGLSKYGAGKNVVSNLVDKGSASKTTHGETKSAIAAGTVTITDAEAQQAKTGLTPEESIARLRRNTEGTQTAAAQIDLGKIEQKAKDERATKNAVVDESFKKSDAAYEAMFNKVSDVYEIMTDADGNVIKNEKGQVLKRKLTEEEVKDLKAREEGNRPQLFYNGINNTLDQAAEKAVDVKGKPNERIYIAYAPTSGNALSEVMIGGYTKIFDNDFWGVTNPTERALQIDKIYGKGIDITCHSRGCMTLGNSISLGDARGEKLSLDGMSVTGFGSAYHMNTLDKQLQDHGAPWRQVKFENNRGDLVGILAGQNKITGGPGDFWATHIWPAEFARTIIGLKPNPHTSYFGEGTKIDPQHPGPQDDIIKAAQERYRSHMETAGKERPFNDGKGNKE